MVTIRPAEPREAETVAGLINAINSLDGPPPELRMTASVVLRDLICDRPRARLRVADFGAGPIAFATSAPLYDALRHADALFLLDLYTAPAHRRRGAARALLAELAAHAVATGAGCLFWGVDDGDDAALLFYRAIGSVSEGRFSGEILEGEALRALAGLA